MKNEGSRLFCLLIPEEMLLVSDIILFGRLGGFKGGAMTDVIQRPKDKNTIHIDYDQILSQSQKKCNSIFHCCYLYFPNFHKQTSK